MFYSHFTKLQKKILCAIIENPGISHKELSTKLKISVSSLSNHIKVLRKDELVLSTHKGRKTFYHISSEFMENNPNFLVDIQSMDESFIVNIYDCDYDDYNYNNYILTRKSKEVLCMIIKNSGLSYQYLIDNLEMSISSLSKHIKLLNECNLISSKNIGKNVFYYANREFIESNSNLLMNIQNEDEKTIINREKLLEAIKKEMLKDASDYDHNCPLTQKRKEILSMIIKNPGISHKELAINLETSASSLCNRIKVLKNYGLVLSRNMGRNILYYINNQFMENNPNFLTNEQNEEERSIVNKEKVLEQQKEFSTEEILALLIKNILTLSANCDAKILLDNFDFIRLYFSTIELVQLLYLLDICKTDTEPTLIQLFKFNSDKSKLLLMRFKDICVYLNRECSNQNSSGSAYYKKKDLYKA